MLTELRVMEHQQTVKICNHYPLIHILIWLYIDLMRWEDYLCCFLKNSHVVWWFAPPCTYNIIMFLNLLILNSQ